MSQSIHMLSIQINTKSFNFVIHNLINNIKLSFFANHMKGSFSFWTVFRYFRVKIQVENTTDFLENCI